MTFARYDAQELEEHGRAFCDAALAGGSTIPNWTNFVLGWFADAAAQDRVVWPPDSDRRYGEFLVDHCHFQAPPKDPDESWLSWYDRAFAAPVEMSLALESEWGSRGAQALSRSLVLDDALKLAVVRARAKVIVFASRDGTDRKDTVDALAKMRRSAADDAPWLWIDVPWNAPQGGAWQPEFGLFH